MLALEPQLTFWLVHFVHSNYLLWCPFCLLLWAPRSFTVLPSNNIWPCTHIVTHTHTHWDREVSQSVNLSLGLRWTGSHATPSQLKTSSTSAMGLMPGMIMPPSPPLISLFLSFLPSLSLPHLLSVCLSLPLSIYLSWKRVLGIGQQHCVGGDYVWSAYSDLTFSMLSLRLKPPLVYSLPPMLPLCSCYFSLLL